RRLIGGTTHVPVRKSACHIWRTGWDSNPRWACTHGGFQDRCPKPLGPLSRRRRLTANAPRGTPGHPRRPAIGFRGNAAPVAAEADGEGAIDMKQFVIGALGAVAAAAIASPAAAQAGCTRERLAEIADQYRASQADGRAIMHMKPMGEWVNYYENFELSSMTFGGVIASPQKVDWDRSFYDTATCMVYVESIITNPELPYVLATMI